MRVLPVAMAQAKEQADNFFLELYTIKLRNGEIRLVACDEDITFNGQEYMAIPIERGDYKATVDGKIDNVDLRIGNVDQSMTLALFQGFDFRGCDCIITRIMYPESLTNPSIYMNIFTGELDAPYMNNKEFKVTIRAKTPNQLTPNRKCQLSCNAVFGDMEDCGVAKITKTGTIKVGSTQSHIYDSDRMETENYWKDGIITIGYESRRISRSSGGFLYVDYPFLLQPTGTYTVEQGCDKSFKTCKERYSNGKNFSGFPSVPFEYIVKT